MNLHSDYLFWLIKDEIQKQNTDIKIFSFDRDKIKKDKV